MQSTGYWINNPVFRQGDEVLKLYACDKCRFLFESDEENVIQCPDCGKMKVRAATEDEIKEFQSRVLEEDDE